MRPDLYGTLCLVSSDQPLAAGNFVPATKVILLYSTKYRVISVLMLEYWNTWLTGRASVLALVMVGMTIVAVALATAAGMRRAAVT